MNGLYICKKGFLVDLLDDDGGFTEEYMEVDEGTLWVRSEDPYRFAGGPDSVRLEGRKEMQDKWMEITEEHLEEYFTRLV